MTIWIETMEPERLFSFRWHPYAIEEGVDYSAEPTTLVTFTLDEVAGGATQADDRRVGLRRDSRIAPREGVQHEQQRLEWTDREYPEVPRRLTGDHRTPLQLARGETMDLYSNAPPGRQHSRRPQEHDPDGQRHSGVAVTTIARRRRADRSPRRSSTSRGSRAPTGSCTRTDVSKRSRDSTFGALLEELGGRREAPALEGRDHRSASRRRRSMGAVGRAASRSECSRSGSSSRAAVHGAGSSCSSERRSTRCSTERSSRSSSACSASCLTSLGISRPRYASDRCHADEPAGGATNMICNTGET